MVEPRPLWLAIEPGLSVELLSSVMGDFPGAFS